MLNVFDKLSPTLQLIIAQLSALGFDFLSLLKGGPAAITQRFAQLSAEFQGAGLDLKAILNGDFASLKKGADITATVEEATKQLREQLEAANTQLSALNSQVSAHQQALTKFGAPVKASDEKAGVTAADIEKALNDRASIKAADQLAKHGLPVALPLAPAGDHTKAGNSKSATYGEFQAMNPGAKAKFLRDGGEIADGPSILGR